MGLYQRLTRHGSGGQAARPARPAPPAAEPASPAQPGNAGGRAITIDEQVEVIGEINEILRKNRLAIRPETFKFTPRRRGATLPILVNAGALALTVAAALGIAALFDKRERNLLSRSAELVTTEGRLIQALKKEAEEQLGRKDQEIARIRGSLESLARDRDRLKLESQAQLARREQELQAALDSELAAQRRKLEREGLQADAVERQLSQLEGRLAEENRQRLAELRRQAEAELADRDAALQALDRQYRESLEAFQRERRQVEQQASQREQELTAQLRAGAAAAQSESSRLAGQLQALAAQREQEKLASDQLLAAYAQALDSWKAARYDEAQRSLGAVRELLSRESFAALPAIRGRLPVERSLVEALSALFEAGKAASAPAPAAGAGEAAASTAALKEAESRLATANRSLAESERERRRLLEEAARSRQELSRLQAGERRRTVQEAQVEALGERLAAGASPADASQEQVLALLETKLRVRQALAAEPLASRYPGLYEELERYLDAYGQEQRQEGQAGAWQEAAVVMEGLASSVPRLDSRRLAAAHGGRTRESFQRFVVRLKEVLK